MCIVKKVTQEKLHTDQVVEVAENVDTKQGWAHSQDVEIELVVGQDTHVSK